jgi:hypothetical protein
MGLLLALAIGCGKHEDPGPEIPQEEVPEEEIPQAEPSVVNFIGIWKADSLPKFSPNDLTSVRHLVISAIATDEIEIQGLFTTNFWHFNSTGRGMKNKKKFFRFYTPLSLKAISK